LQVLSRADPTAPARHRALRATIDWSYELLSDNERHVFDRLSVCAGWTLEPAEAISPGGQVASEDVLDLLGGLVAKSLVLAEPDVNGVPRYRLLETLRQYGHERLALRGDLELTHRRHAEFFLGLAETGAEQLRGTHQAVWLDRLHHEHANFRAALLWSVETESDSPRTHLGLRLAGALAPLWWNTGLVNEGLQWLRRVLAIDASAPPLIRARALIGAGNLWRLGGNFDSARACLTESLSLSRQVGDIRGVAEALRGLGSAELNKAVPEQAEARLTDSLELFRTLDDSWGIGACLSGLGNLACAGGERARAGSSFEESLVHARVQGDAWRSANSMHVLGHLAWAQCSKVQAVALLSGSLSLSRKLDDHRGIAVCLESLALVALYQHLDRLAARLFGAASRLREQAGASWRMWLRADYERGMATLRTHLGDAAFESAWASGRSEALDEVIAEAMTLIDGIG
jgi:tetratricopeptide (TPR) repeat protein